MDAYHCIVMYTCGKYLTICLFNGAHPMSNRSQLFSKAKTNELSKKKTCIYRQKAKIFYSTKCVCWWTWTTPIRWYNVSYRVGSNLIFNCISKLFHKENSWANFFHLFVILLIVLYSLLKSPQVHNKIQLCDLKQLQKSNINIVIYTDPHYYQKTCVWIFW